MARINTTDGRERPRRDARSLREAYVDRILRQAEHSVDEWTAPRRTNLRFREVVHYFVFSQYVAALHKGIVVSLRTIVDALVHPNILGRLEETVQFQEEFVTILTVDLRDPVVDMDPEASLNELERRVLVDGGPTNLVILTDVPVGIEIVVGEL